ncbi:MAG: type II toxin-antitoxin system RelE/ParE family toxin [Desulfatibacillum sp.]|nr:type II toxin-antitoxin system RelE/ParE family toxin [Desulfatibacillum sp.]
MTFEVKWEKGAANTLKKLPKDKAMRIWDKVESIKENPFQYLKQFAGDSCFKLRIGDFRALVDVDLKKEVLKVRVLDKRGRIYKR